MLNDRIWIVIIRILRTKVEMDTWLIWIMLETHMRYRLLCVKLRDWHLYLLCFGLINFVFVIVNNQDYSNLMRILLVSFTLILLDPIFTISAFVCVFRGCSSSEIIVCTTGLCVLVSEITVRITGSYIPTTRCIFWHDNVY